MTERIAGNGTDPGPEIESTDSAVSEGATSAATRTARRPGVVLPVLSTLVTVITASILANALPEMVRSHAAETIAMFHFWFGIPLVLVMAVRTALHGRRWPVAWSSAILAGVTLAVQGLALILPAELDVGRVALALLLVMDGWAIVLVTMDPLAGRSRLVPVRRVLRVAAASTLIGVLAILFGVTDEVELLLAPCLVVVVGAWSLLLDDVLSDHPAFRVGRLDCGARATCPRCGRVQTLGDGAPPNRCVRCGLIVSVEVIPTSRSTEDSDRPDPAPVPRAPRPPLLSPRGARVIFLLTTIEALLAAGLIGVTELLGPGPYEALWASVRFCLLLGAVGLVATVMQFASVRLGRRWPLGLLFVTTVIWFKLTTVVSFTEFDSWSSEMFASEMALVLGLLVYGGTAATFMVGCDLGTPRIPLPRRIMIGAIVGWGFVYGAVQVPLSVMELRQADDFLTWTGDPPAVVFLRDLTQIIGPAGSIGTILAVVLTGTAAFARRRKRETSFETVDDVRVRFDCPECGAAQHAWPGRGACASCGAGYAVRVDEPRCACGYVLFRLNGDSCPECGTDVADARWFASERFDTDVAFEAAEVAAPADTAESSPNARAAGDDAASPEVNPPPAPRSTT